MKDERTLKGYQGHAEGAGEQGRSVSPRGRTAHPIRDEMTISYHMSGSRVGTGGRHALTHLGVAASDLLCRN